MSHNRLDTKADINNYITKRLEQMMFNLIIILSKVVWDP